jgi:hypothetical protein
MEQNRRAPRRIEPIVTQRGEAATKLKPGRSPPQKGTRTHKNRASPFSWLLVPLRGQPDPDFFAAREYFALL